MQLEQAIATAIVALQDPAGMAQKSAPKGLIAFQTPLQTGAVRRGRGLYLHGKSFKFSAHGRFRNADSPALIRHAKECETMGKIYPGYPQPALVTVKMNIAL